jgi:predicted amidohydrolase YtcJ
MIRNALDHGVMIDIEVTNGVITAIIPATGGFHAGDVDAEGDEVLPGLWDEHVHIRSWAQMRSRTNLLPADDSDAVVEILRKHPSDGVEPIVGHGLRWALWANPPQIAALDAVSTTRPVVAFSMDVHSVWVNSVAAREFDVVDIAGDSGILVEHDAFRILGRMSDIDDAVMDTLIAEAFTAAKAQGVVGITSLEMESLTDWDRRIAKGIDLIQVRASLYPERIHEAFDRGLRTGDSLGGRVEMGFLKVITDGSINTRTAYMHAPDEGESSTGVLNTEVTELERLVREETALTVDTALRLARFNVNTHVVDKRYFQGLPSPAAAALAQRVQRAAPVRELAAGAPRPGGLGKKNTVVKLVMSCS